MSNRGGPANGPVSEGELRRGLEEAEFFPVFQGVYEASSGLLLGVEALARWRNREGRLVPPVDFIELAESLGLIGAISRRIWEPAIRSVAARWPEGSPHQPWLSLNVSPVQLADDGWLSLVRQLAASGGLSPGRVVLEITESALLVPHSVEQLTTAREEGFLVAIDDFGKGWSSLSRLSSMPLDVLKLDRDFVVDLGLSPTGSAHSIMRAVVELGHAVRVLTVAEGIEQAWQFADVRRLGVDAVQGYHFGKPSPLPEVAAMTSVEPSVNGWLTDLPSSARELWRTLPELGEE